MARIKITITVDADLLARARSAHPRANDRALFDRALAALVGAGRRSEIDRSYERCDEHPFDEPDAWGNLASFPGAAGRS